MPKKTKGQFNQSEYNKQWSKDNMSCINVRYTTSFVLEFRDALKKLGLKQSHVIKQVMQEVIDKAKEVE